MLCPHFGVWGRVMKKVMLLASVAVVALGIVRPAAAADLSVAPIYKAPPPVVWTPAWFVEGRVGGSWGRFNDFQFLNPVGAAGLGLPGPFIPLNGVSTTSSSWTAGAGFGYFFTNNIFAKVSYQYLGRFRASGFANFPGLGISVRI
jgi:opacity protein-like surface antigen